MFQSWRERQRRKKNAEFSSFINSKITVILRPKKNSKMIEAQGKQAQEVGRRREKKNNSEYKVNAFFLTSIEKWRNSFRGLHVCFSYIFTYMSFSISIHVRLLSITNYWYIYIYILYKVRWESCIPRTKKHSRASKSKCDFFKLVAIILFTPFHECVFHFLVFFFFSPLSQPSSFSESLSLSLSPA